LACLSDQCRRHHDHHEPGMLADEEPCWQKLLAWMSVDIEGFVSRVDMRSTSGYRRTFHRRFGWTAHDDGCSAETHGEPSLNCWTRRGLRDGYTGVFGFWFLVLGCFLVSISSSCLGIDSMQLRWWTERLNQPVVLLVGLKFSYTS
jgi:hypothetical protein